MVVLVSVIFFFLFGFDRLLWVAQKETVDLLLIGSAMMFAMLFFFCVWYPAFSEVQKAQSWQNRREKTSEYAKEEM